MVQSLKWKWDLRLVITVWNKTWMINSNLAENVVSYTPVQRPGTHFHLIFVTSLTVVLSENDSRMYFLIVLITDYCWRSWTCRIAAPYKFYVDWLIDWLIDYMSFYQRTTVNLDRPCGWTQIYGSILYEGEKLGQFHPTHICPPPIRSDPVRMSLRPLASENCRDSRLPCSIVYMMRYLAVLMELQFVTNSGHRAIAYTAVA